MRVQVLLTWALSLSFVDSGPTCDVTLEPDVKYFDFRIPVTDVPTDLTTYICQAQVIPLPMDVIYHAVAFEPIIENKEIMHHLLLFGCYDNTSNEPHKCRSSDGACRSFLVQWSMGIPGQICSYPDTGVRFGKDSFTSLSIQIHWNNARRNSSMSDSSGVRVYYTTRLRKYDVGNVQVGQNDLQIPPGVAHFPQTGSCSSDCTRKLLTEPVYLTRAHTHLHYIGAGGILELIRQGQKMKTIVNDTEFDYNNPPWHDFDEPVQVLPGDELKVTCYYNTRDGDKYRNRTVYWDEGSYGEMCYMFITYHPRMYGFDQCIQFDTNDICSPGGKSAIGGCVFEGFTRYFETVMADDILAHCDGHSSVMRALGSNQSEALVKIDEKIVCTQSCEKSIRVMTEHPCMQGRLGQQLRRVYLPGVDSWNRVRVILDLSARYCTD